VYTTGIPKSETLLDPRILDKAYQTVIIKQNNFLCGVLVNHCRSKPLDKDRG
jgi:hypothetical protein